MIRVPSPLTVGVLRTYSDEVLLGVQRDLAAERRRIDAQAAIVAAEVAYRSRRDLGYQGLAQRLGARTAENLVQKVTGSTSREAQTMVRVGELMTVPSPLDAVGSAVESGELSLEAAEVIRAGLGSADESVSSSDLVGAAEQLLTQAGRMTVEKLAVRAREYRAILDEDHVVDREAALRARRFLKIVRQSDGMTRLTALLDPESAAIVVSAYDSATSPRRGGPRFVNPGDIARAEALVRDTRETEQIAVDTLIDLIRVGSAADPSILGTRQPALRVIVREDDLRAGRGSAHIEGQTEAVSIRTAERHACSSGVIPVVFDSTGQSIDVGREQRLYTRRQRIVLAVRDGGCRHPECDRPPSWCEAHHINEWRRDRGRTDVADGVLLCRYHHLLIHNNGWRVTRERSDYFLVPPRTLDSAQTPIPMPSKSALVRQIAS
jgi:hypothetical protein